MSLSRSKAYKTMLLDESRNLSSLNLTLLYSKESGVSEEEVKGLIAKAMKEFAASLVTE